jgi:3'-5' exoribonuclease
MTPFEDLLELVYMLPAHLKTVCYVVLNDSHFAESPASAGHHPGPHRERGGLALHTLEVAQAAIGLAGTDTRLAERALVAAVFHDYGKVHEYAFRDGTTVKLPFYQRIGHVVFGFTTFLQAAKGLLTEEEQEDIGHALLAHHGRREWGSPVEPQTRLAFILHTADMISTKGVTK